jgi:hypothetical protein
MVLVAVEACFAVVGLHVLDLLSLLTVQNRKVGGLISASALYSSI